MIQKFTRTKARRPVVPKKKTELRLSTYVKYATHAHAFSPQAATCRRRTRAALASAAQRKYLGLWFLFLLSHDRLGGDHHRPCNLYHRDRLVPHLRTDERAKMRTKAQGQGGVDGLARKGLKNFCANRHGGNHRRHPANCRGHHGRRRVRADVHGGRAPYKTAAVDGPKGGRAPYEPAAVDGPTHHSNGPSHHSTRKSIHLRHVRALLCPCQDILHRQQSLFQV